MWRASMCGWRGEAKAVSGLRLVLSGAAPDAAGTPHARARAGTQGRVWGCTRTRTRECRSACVAVLAVLASGLAPSTLKRLDAAPTFSAWTRARSAARCSATAAVCRAIAAAMSVAVCPSSFTSAWARGVARREQQHGNQSEEAGGGRPGGGRAEGGASSVAASSSTSKMAHWPPRRRARR